MRRMIAFAIFLGLVTTTAVLSSQFVGGQWYHQLMHQPAWNPPPIMLASVWAVLYVLMAVSAWMVWDTLRGLAQTALGLWGLQLLLGIAWSWIFFELHRIGWAMAVMGIWLLLVLVVIKAFRVIKPEASNLMIPLGVWLLFSLLLNFVQWHLNGGGVGSVFN